jgi:hypothetical protein
MDEHLDEKQNELDATTENELKKIKLSLEHGMDLSQSSVSPDMPPEIEGQFLDYIQEWEDQYAQRKMTTVFNMAGGPVFRPVGEIPDEEISAALDEAMELLNKHTIHVDTLCDVDDRELYRFITGEFLSEKINDIRIEGMMHSFIYEDFHPNHPYDIKKRCTEVIEYLADRKGPDRMIPWGLADQVACGGQVYTKEDLNEHVIRFRKLFSSLTLTEFNYLSVTVSETEDEATAVAFVHYSGITEDGQAMELTGNCTFYLRCKYEWWMIHQLETPWKIMG